MDLERMSTNELKTLEGDLISKRIRLLEEMNNMLYAKHDAQYTKEYEEAQTMYRSLLRRITEVQDQIKISAGRVGRPGIGIGKVVKMTLPEEDWKKIESLVKNGHASSYADYFRQLHQNQ
ncbi:hypothetical protein [Paenibacillus hubeiensis]|uniref:hypothetical protein n=1 Tax=Paenibacillus hubeiensis TaxID=3077330 RepID=UPI0031BBADCE